MNTMRRLTSNYAKPAVIPPAPRSRLAELLGEQAHGEGFSPSVLPGVRYMRSTMHVPRSPIAYEPSIVIVGQGRKTGYLGGQRYVYDANHYLVLTVPLPFECETEGTPEEPVLGLAIGVHPPAVAEVLMQMDALAALPSHPKALQSTELDGVLASAAVRLLECLRSPQEARVLGPGLVREITYRVLLGTLGGNLRALVAPHSHFGQITRVLTRIHTDFAHPHDMATLAREAGMSVSTFHGHFKAVTASSPLQYLKNVRLHKARMMMVQEGATAGHAALQVGYESASQFSREFKRLFGEGPAAEAQRLRSMLLRLA